MESFWSNQCTVKQLQSRISAYGIDMDGIEKPKKKDYVLKLSQLDPVKRLSVQKAATVAELKAEANLLQLSVSGKKKQDYVDALLDHYKSSKSPKKKQIKGSNAPISSSNTTTTTATERKKVQASQSKIITEPTTALAPPSEATSIKSKEPKSALERLLRKQSDEKKTATQRRPLALTKRKRSPEETNTATENISKKPFQRAKTVPDAKSEPTCTLKIENFVRPFTDKAVKQLVQEQGPYVENGFWMNHIKSVCYVTYESPEVATATRNALYNLVWPSYSKKALVAEYATETAMDVIAQRSTRKSVNNAKDSIKTSKGPATTGFGGRRGGAPAALQNHNSTSGNNNSKRGFSRKNGGFKPPPHTMDELFMKTKATPALYYLPNNPKDVL